MGKYFCFIIIYIMHYGKITLHVFIKQVSVSSYWKMSSGSDLTRDADSTEKSKALISHQQYDYYPSVKLNCTKPLQ